jgi:hypothetical protein
MDYVVVFGTILEGKACEHTWTNDLGYIRFMLLRIWISN